jgi:hypothetical protein
MKWNSSRKTPYVPNEGCAHKKTYQKLYINLVKFVTSTSIRNHITSVLKVIEWPKSNS